MTKKLDSLRKHPYYTVTENGNGYKCPLCDSKLYCADSWMDQMMDGAIVHYCENNDEHIFWKNSMSRTPILYLNPNATNQSFDYDKKYLLTEGKWEEVNV